LAPEKLTAAMRLLSTKTHPTLVEKDPELRMGTLVGVIKKTHTKKYRIFSHNKMVVSDRRPFSLILAEGETMVLYTANPNNTNSKSVAAKYEIN
jgi:hypothetical protein